MRRSQLSFTVVIAALLLWQLFGRRFPEVLYRPVLLAIGALVIATSAWYLLDYWKLARERADAKREQR